MSDDPREPEVFDIVEQDLHEGFADAFSPTAEAYERLVATFPANDGPTAVVWRYRAVHDGDFMGLAPTNREIQIEGVTVATPGTDGWQLARYIDWLSVAGQLGLTLSGRPVVRVLPTADDDGVGPTS